MSAQEEFWWEAGLGEWLRAVGILIGGVAGATVLVLVLDYLVKLLPPM